MRQIIFSMALALIVTGVSTLTGCSGVPRTKWTDPVAKLMISPEGIAPNHYVKIQNALVESGKFVVIDRGMAYEEIKKEQEREYANEPGRYLDREKLARWGRLHGVGGVVIAHADCIVKNGWLFKKNYVHCHEYLAVVDTVSAEVIATANDDQNGDSNEYASIAPEWESAVSKLESAYPSHFETKTDEKNLREYKDMVAEESQRHKEQAAKQQQEINRQIAAEAKVEEKK